MERVHTGLGRWCSTVWHELRKPLTTLLSPLDELARDPACVEIRPRLITIQRSARLLLQLLDSLLLLAKLQDSPSLTRMAVENDPELSEGDSAFLSRLDAVICTELDNPALDIRMICARMHFSAKQLQRKVRMLTGLTPTEYLRQKRLRRAEEILLQGKSVSRTAYAAGFSSQSYFTTCFKKWAGETPRAWQKRMLSQCAVVTRKLPDR